ncbi:MAG: tetratricopeptide repeat protein [Chitinophagaceae bacterium]
MRSLKLLWLLYPGLFLLGSCSTPEKPVTTEEAREFAHQLELSIGKRDPSFMNDAIDIDEVIKRAGINNSNNGRAFGSGLKQSASMGNRITEGITEEGTYQLVKPYEKEGKQHLIFRLYDDGGINYHDIELKKKKGVVKIADVYIYATGEALSATIKNLYEQLSGMEDKLTKDKNWVSSLTEIREKLNKGKNKEAYDLFMEIPAEARTSKIFRIIKVQICTGMSDELHQQSVEELLAAFPNEPDMQLMLIDAYFMRKEYDKALGAVNAIDKMINKDPFLDYYRYLCYNVMQQPEKAREHLIKVTKAYKDFPDARLELIVTYLDEKKYDSARIAVSEFRAKKTFPQEKLEKILSVYPDFSSE